jgi:hypothetical protein
MKRSVNFIFLIVFVASMLPMALFGQHFGEFDDLPMWWQVDSVYAKAGVRRVKVIHSFNTTDPFKGVAAKGRIDIWLDGQGRITHKLVYATGDTVHLAVAMHYSYDSHGHLVSEQSLLVPDLTSVVKEQNYTNVYDSLQRLVSTVRLQPWGESDTVAYLYDEKGRKTGEYRSHAVEGSGFISWKYIERADSTSIITTQHGLLNKRLRKKVDVSMTQHETYNGRGQIKRCTYEVSNDVAASSIGIPLKDEYMYDPLGRLVTKREYIVGATYLHHFRYNIQELTANYMYTRIAPEGITNNASMVFENLYQFNNDGLLISYCSGGARRDEVECDRVFYEK